MARSDGWSRKSCDAAATTFVCLAGGRRSIASLVPKSPDELLRLPFRNPILLHPPAHGLPLSKRHLSTLPPSWLVDNRRWFSGDVDPRTPSPPGEVRKVLDQRLDLSLEFFIAMLGAFASELEDVG